ncbi:hypothetical protein AB0J35_57220 [Nonomuraea angiospora]|uniref:hypothetical protein n=1 Tax=Nonomuraea angiospora TaxID=46172 RepID=UPI00343D5C78
MSSAMVKVRWAVQEAAAPPVVLLAVPRVRDARRRAGEGELERAAGVAGRRSGVLDAGAVGVTCLKGAESSQELGLVVDQLVHLEVTLEDQPLVNPLEWGLVMVLDLFSGLDVNRSGIGGDSMG